MNAISALRVPCLLAAVVAAAGPIATAQDQPERQPFQTEVNFVRVDMYPTIDGRPVTDLAAADVEVLEDGVPQKIESFEHIAIAGPRTQTTRREPSTVDEMRRAAREPRARVLVLFLDPRSVDLEGSMKIRQPLINALNALIGGDDLIAVMTPEMSANQLTFTRRTASIEDLLAKHWGMKGWLGTRDPVELSYEACYPTIAISQEMIKRRREVKTLDALDGLVQHLRALREERKAVITISDGWPLYGPTQTLIADSGPQAVPRPGVVFDPRAGRPKIGDPRAPVAVSSDGPVSIDHAKCDADRHELSGLSNEERFITLMRKANHSNVSFYPISPAGALSPQPTLDRIQSLDMMAAITDGVAIVQPGEMDPGLQRVVDDLSWYYLLGYYSNAKADDRFHRITVRVKRSAVQVRARSGYLAAKPVDAALPIAPRISEAESAEGRIVTEAIGVLGVLARERPLRVQAASSWTAAGEAAVWVVAEVSRIVSGDDWSKGGQAEVRLVDAGGATVAAQKVALASSAGPISARVLLKPATPLSPGDYQVQVRATSTGLLPASDLVRIAVAQAPAGSGVSFNRRGITTGNREMPTADLRFRRGERVILLLPAESSDAASARLLDRAGKALAIPVNAAIRNEDDGSRWRALELALAPLAPGDYILESTAGSERTLTAFRVVP